MGDSHATAHRPIFAPRAGARAGMAASLRPRRVPRGPTLNGYLPPVRRAARPPAICAPVAIFQPMKMTFRWFGEHDDCIHLWQVRQIPGAPGIVGALFDVPVGEVWPVEKI